jgi:N-acetylglucosamine kinase-like BadF-type ATPase
MKNDALIQQINKELTIELAQKISMAQIHQQLSEYVNNLIRNNFQQLVNVLYRIDISEKKLTALLQQPQQLQAGNIIATLIIERQIEKIESRKVFSKKPTEQTDEEQW